MCVCVCVHVCRMQQDSKRRNLEKQSHCAASCKCLVVCYSSRSTLSLMHGNCGSFFRRDYTFNGAAKMNADLSQWSVENLKSMERTFDGATRFSGKGLEQWDVSQVDDFTGFFSWTKTTFTPCTQRKIANSWGAQSLRVSLSKLEEWSKKTCPPLTDADFKTATCECYCANLSRTLYVHAIP